MTFGGVAVAAYSGTCGRFSRAANVDCVVMQNTAVIAIAFLIRRLFAHVIRVSPFLGAVLQAQKDFLQGDLAIWISTVTTGSNPVPLTRSRTNRPSACRATR